MHIEYLLQTDCFQNLSEGEAGDIHVCGWHKQTSSPQPSLTVLEKKQKKNNTIYNFTTNILT